MSVATNLKHSIIVLAWVWGSGLLVYWVVSQFSDAPFDLTTGLTYLTLGAVFGALIDLAAKRMAR
jgi:hypothetical protein